MPDLAPRSRFSPKWIIGGVAVLVLLLVGGPWIYVTFLNDDQPEKLSLPAASAASGPSTTADSSSAPAAGSSAAAGSAASSGSLNGQWTVGRNSIVGYRVKEILLGQSSSAVGRTSDVTGDLTVEGGSLTAAKFTADMTTVKSDKSQRDGQFHGRIMATGTHPTATFAATAPIVVPADAVAGKQFTGKATGDLTLHGKTKSVTFDVTGQKTAAGFDVTAQIPIVFADFDISNPSGGPAQVGDEGVLEVLLKLTPKA
jgi:polyisoprenoid-binding protein YceI